MHKHTLTANIRSATGRKVKEVRAKGNIPATVYGKSIKSVSIEVDADDFHHIYKNAGETGLIEIVVDRDVRPVLIYNVQKHPVTNQILNIEFHQVDLKEKVHAKIPLQFIGEPAAVKEKLGVLLTLISDVEVEALPTDLPEKIEVHMENLAAVNEQITVKDLPIPPRVTLLTDPSIIVAKIVALVIEKEPEPTPAATTELPDNAEQTETPQQKGEEKQAAASPDRPAKPEEKTKAP